MNTHGQTGESRPKGSANSAEPSGPDEYSSLDEQSSLDEPSSPDKDLLAALTGKDANRERAVAYRTRRVVLGSIGVMKDQREDRSRARGVAIAVTLLVLALIAPLVWEATDSLIAGEHLADPGSQLSLWACVLCPTLLGAALVAGWMRKRL